MKLTVTLIDKNGDTVKQIDCNSEDVLDVSVVKFEDKFYSYQAGLNLRNIKFQEIKPPYEFKPENNL